MSANTVAVIAVVAFAIVGLLAWESYEATQNSLASQAGKAVSGLFGGLL